MTESERHPIIRMQNIVKTFAGGVIAVDNVSVDILAGEFFALLGPSGCGKTTLLRMIAGFEIPSAGDVLLDGQSLLIVPPNQRPVNMVFQSYAVFPHMTVFDNVAYGLKVAGIAKTEIRSRVSEALELVQLQDFARRKPDQLSGGQRQRVALARALVKKPKVLLLDEPLSALDAKLREAMQLELVKLQHAVGITFIIVTHDQDEALSMADRIAVMNKGAIQQIASPKELYEYPRTRFVADFIGKMNLLSASVKNSAADKTTIDIKGLGEITVPQSVVGTDTIEIAVRPEKMKFYSESPQQGSQAIAFPAQVNNIAYHGSESHVFVQTTAGIELTATVQNASRSGSTPMLNQPIWIGWQPEDTLILAE